MSFFGISMYIVKNTDFFLNFHIHITIIFPYTIFFSLRLLIVIYSLKQKALVHNHFCSNGRNFWIAAFLISFLFCSCHCSAPTLDGDR